MDKVLIVAYYNHKPIDAELVNNSTYNIKSAINDLALAIEMSKGISRKNLNFSLTNLKNVLIYINEERNGKSK